MKRSLLYLSILGLLVTIPANSAVTVEETTDAEYIINAGYSQATAEDIFMQKNRMNGKSIEPLYEKSHNKFVKACKKLHAYIDPGIDNPDERLHHDIKRSPSASDL
jgi:hypothetical protein